MADKGKLPSGLAGMLQYDESTNSKFRIGPGYVIVFGIVFAVVISLLHFFG